MANEQASETQHTPELERILTAVAAHDRLLGTDLRNELSQLCAKFVETEAERGDLMGALEQRPIPPSSSDVFKALGNPIRWMERYRKWCEQARAAIDKARGEEA